MANPNADTRRPNRGRVISVRLTDTELEKLRRDSARMGLAPSVFLRSAALDALDAGGALPSVAAANDTGPQVPLRELVELRTEVNRLGVNVNQIARLSNQSRALVVTRENEAVGVSATLAETKAVLEDVLVALGGYRKPTQ